MDIKYYGTFPNTTTEFTSEDGRTIIKLSTSEGLYVTTETIEDGRVVDLSSQQGADMAGMLSIYNWKQAEISGMMKNK